MSGLGPVVVSAALVGRTCCSGTGERERATNASPSLVPIPRFEIPTSILAPVTSINVNADTRYSTHLQYSTVSILPARTRLGLSPLPTADERCCSTAPSLPPFARQAAAASPPTFPCEHCRDIRQEQLPVSQRRLQEGMPSAATPRTIPNPPGPRRTPGWTRPISPSAWPTRRIRYVPGSTGS